ncbi:MAG: amidohydrolase family protein [Ignavibacteriales bacterium]|nr:amidohydrolase family protein [Ignavibacteriales bacterium]
MIRRWSTLMFLLSLAVGWLFGQTAPTTGLRDNTPTIHAFTNARIVVAPGKIITRGTLVVRNGTIEAVGEKVSPPADARIWDLDGRTLYPGLIELSSDLGMPKPAQAQTGGPFAAPAQQTQAEKPKGAAHWNAKMHAEVNADEEFTPDSKAAEKLRSQGFTLALVAPQTGIFRGTSALVGLGDDVVTGLVVKRRVAQHLNIESSGGFGSGYPSSLMGIIAFVRQTYFDADWYRKAQDAYARNPAGQKHPEVNNALSALADAIQTKIPTVIEVASDLNFLRAAKLGKEFSLNLWILGSGQEYLRIDAVKATKVPVLVPLNFPEAPSVETPEEALNASLEDMRHYDAAPENAGRLQNAGVSIALTAAQLKDAGTFLAQARKAIERGLSADAALTALTTTPAKMLGVEKQYGTLEQGKVANLVITDGDLFAERTKIQEVWIDGKRYDVKPPPLADVRGIWDFTSDRANGTLTLRGDIEKPTGSLNARAKDVRFATVSVSGGRLAVTFAADSIGIPGIVLMSGTGNDKEMFGVIETPDGSSFGWHATRTSPARVEPDTAKPKKVDMATASLMFPPTEYGRPKLPEQPANILIKNATIWTQGPQGKLVNADMLVTKGKIAQVGLNIAVPKDAVVIDATGKHLSPGVIDAHSHTAINGGVNEGGQAITPETRVEDVINPDDIWIYRQLAGGTTMALVVHGSANPIGGQSSILKWRWGASAEELPLAGAPLGVKFALGENVKQSSMTPQRGVAARYPQTRMGVEELIRDRFNAALDYERSWKEWERNKLMVPPRKDLELDCLLEIVKGKREIHAHAYRQDEMLMLIRVAEEYGIHVASFEHGLEGYKIADVIAKHGAGVSTFSDWWAYKIEAWDAIPGNGPLLHNQGVLVAYKSDNDQLASRLNWEAAKAVKYGLSEEEAFKFVTINPAKHLKVDKWVGSLEVGKDADFVLWSGNPLSVYSRCEQTWVDGKKYFDIQEDKQMQEQIVKERAALIQKVLATKKPQAAPAGGPPGRFRRPNESDQQSTIGEGQSHETN